MKMIKQLADGAEKLEGKIEGLEMELRRLSSAKGKEDRADVDKAVCLPFVSNGKGSSRKLHVVRLGSPEMPKHRWVTSCGFRFALASGEGHLTTNGFVKSELCRRCFRQGDVSESSFSSSSAEPVSSD
eukprot:5371594-Karenia_brevis.AAC.1